MELLGHGEDDVEVLHRQQVLLLGFEPPGLAQALTSRAVSISAAVVEHLLMATVVALLHRTAENGSSTVDEVAHHPRLLSRQRRQSRGELPENVRYPQRRGRGARPGRRLLTHPYWSPTVRRASGSGIRSSGLGVSHR